MGNLEAIKFLVEHGADVNGGNIAAGMGETNIIDYLIKNKTNINAVGMDNTGVKIRSALEEAIIIGSYDIVKLLVKAGANLEYQNTCAKCFITVF